MQPCSSARDGIAVGRSGSIDDVPFAVLANLYVALRKAKVAGKKRLRDFGSKQQAGDRKALLTTAWLRIANLCGHGGSFLAGRATDDRFVPAQILLPDESFKVACLLVPLLDSTHSYLGMKESKLADAFVKALDLIPDGDDAQWLKHHKEHEYRPQRWKHDANIIDGNFATVLMAVLTGRCPTESSLTIGQVWEALDLLSKSSRGRMRRIARVARVAKRDENEVGNIPYAWSSETEKTEDRASMALRSLIQHGTAREVAEVSRIILKDVEIRLSEDLFLSWLHPSAKQHYTQIHDIHRLLKDCHDPGFEMGEASVQVGQYASVMLTMRPSRKNLETICNRLRGSGELSSEGGGDAEDVMESVVRTDAELNRRPYFVMEPKLDGERMQLHKWKPSSTDEAPREYEVRTFSRRGNDSSAMYAEALRSVVLSAVQAHSFILDGEIMIWDDLKASWLRFEDTREVATAISKRAVPEGSSYTLVYMVFDIMYVDQGPRKGESRRSGNMVIRLPLYKRRQLLEKLVQQREEAHSPGVRAKLQVVDMERGHDESELIQALQRFETLGYEGVVAKNPDKAYALAERNLEVSIKLKPDYFDGGIQDLDVVILGAKYSTSRGHRAQRAGQLSSFLIGVRSDSSEIPLWKGRGVEWEQKMKTCKWVPVGSVGTGYSDQELDELQKEFQGEWKSFNCKDLPDHFERREYASTLLSQVAKWIEPWKSVVLTIRAFELNRRLFALRFPRVDRINWAKPYYEVPTFTQLLDLDDNKLPALIRPDDADADDVFGIETRKKSRVVYDAEEAEAVERARNEGHLISGGRSSRAVISSALGAEVQNVQRLSTALEGFRFYVIAEDGPSKKEIELRIHELGGLFVQSYSSSVDFVVCSDATLGKVSLLRDRFTTTSNRADTSSILKRTWVDNCYSLKSHTLPTSHDIVYATEDLESKLYKDADKFGDPWSRDTDIETLSRSLHQVEESATNYRVLQLNPEDLIDIDKRLRENTTRTGNVFDGMNVYIPPTGQKLPGCICMLLGLGASLSNALGPEVNLVLLHSSEIDDWNGNKELYNAKLVTELWVRQSVQAGRMLS